MNPRHCFLHASREREVTGAGVPRWCEARAAATWLLVAFACLAVPIPALAAEAAVHQKVETPCGRLAAAKSASPNCTATSAIRENPDTSVDDDDGATAAILIHSKGIPNLPQLLTDLPTPIASLAILASNCFLRGPPAATAFTA
jgi:hypothetical protein